MIEHKNRKDAASLSLMRIEGESLRTVPIALKAWFQDSLVRQNDKIAACLSSTRIDGHGLPKRGGGRGLRCGYHVRTTCALARFGMESKIKSKSLPD